MNNPSSYFRVFLGNVISKFSSGLCRRIGTLGTMQSPSKTTLFCRRKLSFVVWVLQFQNVNFFVAIEGTDLIDRSNAREIMAKKIVVSVTQYNITINGKNVNVQTKHNANTARAVNHFLSS